MRLAALAVLLTLCVPVQLLGQRSTGNTSPSGSGVGNSGGASSGGYSGGGFHSSGPSTSGGSGGYSGGGGSHSSGPSSSGGYSGGNAGGARSGSYSGSSPSNGGSRSTGSAVPSNSGVHSGSAHSTPTQGAPHSNVRTGNAGSERWSGGNSSSELRNNGSALSRPISQVVPVQQQEWILEALRLNTSSANLKSTVAADKIDADLKGFGVAPNKAAYREQINKIGGLDISRKEPGWFAKHILGKQGKQQAALAPTPRPCPGEECKPVLPPKPCVGKHCKPAPPPPAKPPTPPVSGICLSGIPTPTGGCAPWGYFERCHRSACYLQLATVDSAYCDSILNRIRREEASTISLEAQQRLVCSFDPQSVACANAGQDLQQTHARIEQLRRQYQMCRMSAGWQSVRYP